MMSLAAARKMPSAMWLRHEFPVQRIRTMGLVLTTCSVINHRHASEKFSKFLRPESRGFCDTAHSNGVYWIVSGDDESRFAIGHHNVATLPSYMISELLEHPHGLALADARNLWHGITPLPRPQQPLGSERPSGCPPLPRQAKAGSPRECCPMHPPASGPDSSSRVVRGNSPQILLPIQSTELCIS